MSFTVVATVRRAVRACVPAFALSFAVLAPMSVVPAQVPSEPASPAPRHAITLVGGVSQFDLSGTGTAGMVGVRIERALHSWLVAEGALATMRPSEDLLVRTRYWLPEAQLQLQLPGPQVRPYVGVGSGYVIRDNDRDDRWATSAAAGLRLGGARQRVELRTELRVRGIGRNFGASTADWSAGLGYRF